MTCKYKDRYSGNGKHVHTAEVTHKYTGLWAPLRGCWQSFWHLIVSIRPMGHCYFGILLSLSERWDIVILTSHCLCQNDGTLSFWHLTVSIVILTSHCLYQNYGTKAKRFLFLFLLRVPCQNYFQLFLSPRLDKFHYWNFRRRKAADVWQYVQVWGNLHTLPFRPTLGEPPGFC